MTDNAGERDKSILERLNAQQIKVNNLPLTSNELDEIAKARRFLYVTTITGTVIGLMAGGIITLGKSNSILSKTLASFGSGIAGTTLGCAFGVQSGMKKLLELQSNLGEELCELERLRTTLRKRGPIESSQFTGEAAEAERDRLTKIFKNRTRSADN